MSGAQRTYVAMLLKCQSLKLTWRRLMNFWTRKELFMLVVIVVCSCTANAWKGEGNWIQ